MISNRMVVKEFVTELDRRGLTDRRIRKYTILIRKLHNIRLMKLTKRNVDNFFFYLRDAPLSDETKKDYWIMFRIFVKWLKPNIDTRVYRLKLSNRIKLPEEILTLEEVKNILLSANSIRDRAMISLLYDSGCRPSELLTLQKKDISFDEGLIVFFNGKTGNRKIRIITTLDSDKFINEYLNINRKNLLFGELGIDRLNQIVKELAQKIGIQKRVYSYIFRHSRATHLAKYLTEAQMKVYLGWSMGSKMVAIYVHLSGRDMDQRVMELNHNPTAFIPSESFKEFLFELHQKWLNSRKIKV